MTDKSFQMDVMQEFELSPGWKILKESLAKMEVQALRALAVEDPTNVGKISFWQATVRACRVILDEPKRIIREGKNEVKNG